MKRVYMQPETFAIVPKYHGCLLQSASDPNRVLSGGPTNPEDDGKDLPGTVGETNGETDPFAGKGQGAGGNGSRSKTWSTWD